VDELGHRRVSARSGLSAKVLRSYAAAGLLVLLCTDGLTAQADAGAAVHRRADRSGR
jgi:hypothetical protein